MRRRLYFLIKKDVSFKRVYLKDFYFKIKSSGKNRINITRKTLREHAYFKIALKIDDYPYSLSMPPRGGAGGAKNLKAPDNRKGSL
jgi:hypothetical protein